MSKAIGVISGGLEIAGGIALEVVTPGNPMGIMMIAQGIVTEAGAIAQMLGSKSGLGVTTRTPAAHRRVIRGMQRLGGTIVYQSTTGSTNRQYNLVIAVASHPCEAFVNLYLDGRQVYWESSSYNQTVNGYNFGGNADNNSHTGPNGVQYNFGGLVFCAAFQGNQTSDPTVVGGAWVGPSTIEGNSPASYPGFCSALQANDSTWSPTANGTPYLAGCTYVYLKIEADAGTFPQFPEIRFTMMGKNNIWDPRTSTYGYTANAALQIADAITDATWGLGDNTVNQDQLIAAANICDEQVACQGGLTSWEPETIYTVGMAYSEGGNTYTVVSNYTSGATFGATDLANTTETSGTTLTEAQFSLHYNYDTSTGPGEALQHMIESKQFRITRAGGEWFIFPPSWQGPSFTFDENALLADVQWSEKRPIDQLCNRVTGTYIAPNYPYNVAGNLYDSNGFWNGQTQNNFPYSFQPTDFPMYACDVLHGYDEDIYLVADTPNQGSYNSANAYAAGAVVIYSAALWKANEAVPAGSAPGSTDGSGNPYWSATGNYLPLDLNLDTTLSISEAQRLAKIALLRTRQQGAGTLTMSLAAFQMMAMDVIEFNCAALSWSDKLLEVAGAPGAEITLRCAPPPSAAGDDLGSEESAPAVWCEVSVNETDPSVYEWDDATEELTPYDVPAYTGGANVWTVGAPTNLEATGGLEAALVAPDGTVTPRIELGWTEPTDTYVTNGGSIEIQICLHGTGAWQDALMVGGQTTLAYLGGVVSGLIYDVQIRSVRPSGAASAWVQALDIAVGVAVSNAVLAAVAPAGTLLGLALSATAAEIIVNPFTASAAGATASCLPAGAVTLTGLLPATEYFVYYVDATFAGGAITPIATTNTADFLFKAGYWLIGSVTIPPYNAAGATTFHPSTVSNLGPTSVTGEASKSIQVVSLTNGSGSFFGEALIGGFPGIGIAASVFLGSVLANVSVTGASASWLVTAIDTAGGGSGGKPPGPFGPLNPRGAWAADTAYNLWDTYTITLEFGPSTHRRLVPVTFLVVIPYTSGSSWGATDYSLACMVLASGTGPTSGAFVQNLCPAPENGGSMAGVLVDVTVNAPAAAGQCVLTISGISDQIVPF